MKKATILFLCILLLVCSACSKTNTDIENTTDVDKDSTSATVVKVSKHSIPNMNTSTIS